MRITKISVKGLFGMFDHEIPLNQESRITIVHGPNGVGKTVLMRLVHGLFHYEYEYISSIPFECLRLDYEDGTLLTVEKKVRDDGESKKLALFINCIAENGEKHSPFDLVLSGKMFLAETVLEKRPNLTLVVMSDGRMFWAKNVDKQYVEDIRENFPRKGRPFEEIYLRMSTQPAIYSKEDLLDGDRVLHDEVYGELPEWFKTIRAESKSRFVSTWRLLQEVPEPATDLLEEGQPSRQYREMVEALERISDADDDDMSFVRFPGMQSTIDEVERYFTPLEDSEIESLQYGLKHLEQLQTDDSYTNFLLKGEIEDKIREIEVEIEDLKSQYFDALELARLLNERLLFKSFVIDEDQFIVFLHSEKDGGKYIPFSALSSGEQQLLTLYYQLLVKTEPDTLVMIDEPELSMNVVWQRNFLKDLQRIIELRKFDVLIATHSPQIIHDKWDWMVPLGEQVDD